MDWPLAIDRNRTALLAIIEALMASLGLVGGGRLTMVPLFLYRKALLILRTAESAVRRLIIVFAHEMKLRGVKLRVARRDGLDAFLYSLRPTPRDEPAIPAFQLIDPLKAFGREVPDLDGIELYDTSDLQSSEGFDRTPISAVSLGLRILALKNALDNLSKQGRRLACWYAQRDLAYKQKLAHRYSPMRPGPAPASRRRKNREIDQILLECHLLAIYTTSTPDSS